ncbi:aromatase/cyclase [Frankia sp. AgB32]|uniref:aromatase/cyclase n=1 Tax=Frankia sp. AgB32 TaxID=631119 RepID=UPI00200C1CE1|nr:aromatase/cyclase [Frankia sp. AgB32]MCK9895441.1 aromatase/cyclase [Frankia sp. AgB32]
MAKDTAVRDKANEREAEHEITIEAPAAEVYRLLADVENWPRLFPPSVYVDRVESDGDTERIRIWATANGEPKNWSSRRVLDREGLKITFWQEVSAPPVAQMRGTWLIEPQSPHRTRLRLLHTFRAVDDTPEGLAWIERAVDENSRAELPGLKAAVELATGTADLTLSFTDWVRIEGSAKDAYDFVNEADQWEQRLPHVSSVQLTETTPGLQVLRMETLTRDGSSHVTESVRVCFPHRRIVYKQTTLPALMDLHTGYWEFEENPAGFTTAVSQHTVIIKPENIAAVLGPQAGVAEARTFIRDALGTNSRTTLEHARRHAEGRR